MSSDPLQIRITRRGAAATLHVTGELDIHTAPALSETLESLCDDGCTTVVIDAAKISFVDSSGLRLIVAAGNRFAGVGGRLSLDGMSGAVARVLEVTGLIDRYRHDGPDTQT